MRFCARSRMCAAAGEPAPGERRSAARNSAMAASASRSASQHAIHAAVAATAKLSDRRTWSQSSSAQAERSSKSSCDCNQKNPPLAAALSIRRNTRRAAQAQSVICSCHDQQRLRSSMCWAEPRPAPAAAAQEALAANDRLKVCFTLLQAAERHADHPGEPLPDFVRRARRRRHGADEPGLGYRPTAGAKRAASCMVPGAAATTRGRILDDIAAMLAPLDAGRGWRPQPLAARPQVLGAALPQFDRRPDPARHDRRHHLGRPRRAATACIFWSWTCTRRSTRCRASSPRKTIDGARVWRIAEADRPLVRAFMAGLNETAPLKFDHPGLGTTATRAGGPAGHPERHRHDRRACAGAARRRA